MEWPDLARSPFVRFLVSGACNTLASWALYLVLLRFLPYGWSYTLAYAAGIGLAYVLYRYVVFQRTGGPLGLLWVALTYAVQYLLGLAAVWVWAGLLAWPVELAPLFAVGLTLPLTFVLNRRIFQRGIRSQPSISEPSA